MTAAGFEGGGAMDGLDSEVYLYIDSRQLEAMAGSMTYDLFTSCHILGCVDAMLRFTHAIGSLKLAVLVPVHAYITNHYGVCMWYQT
jgi:hypothetical protein